MKTEILGFLNHQAPQWTQEMSFSGVNELPQDSIYAGGIELPFASKNDFAILVRQRYDQLNSTLYELSVEMTYLTPSNSSGSKENIVFQKKDVDISNLYFGLQALYKYNYYTL